MRRKGKGVRRKVREGTGWSERERGMRNEAGARMGRSRAILVAGRSGSDSWGLVDWGR